jgi:hypothetical protein
MLFPTWTVGDSSKFNTELPTTATLPKPVGYLSKIYAPQTKISEGLTSISECVFEALLCSSNEDFESSNKDLRLCFERILNE